MAIFQVFTNHMQDVVYLLAGIHYLHDASTSVFQVLYGSYTGCSFTSGWHPKPRRNQPHLTWTPHCRSQSKIQRRPRQGRQQI
jgi:hypothetical protein